MHRLVIQVDKKFQVDQKISSDTNLNHSAQTINTIPNYNQIFPISLILHYTRKLNMFNLTVQQNTENQSLRLKFSDDHLTSPTPLMHRAFGSYFNGFSL